LANKGNLGDNGSSRVYPPYAISPLQGIAKAAGNKKVIFNDGSDIRHAKWLAERADYVVFVAGYDCNDEGEYVSNDQAGNYMDPIGGDRCQSLGLHPDEIRLIKEVGPVNDRSVVILIGGSMIMMEEWKDYVNGILMAYYPGMEGGTAIGQILFGDVNPSGKLPFVIPKKETDLPEVNWDTEKQRYDYYHGYTKLEKESIESAYPYGFGLSYTKFEITGVYFSRRGDAIEAECSVKNTGERAGTQVIQFYVGFSQSSVDRPVKVLKGFQRVPLKPGEKKKVTIVTPIAQLEWFNDRKDAWELEHMEYDLYLGTSSSEKDLIQGKLSL
ncbi:MAG TPA: glycosyl hydrolase, partial [Lachnospiraceae bacterium]|nr:glycosyl hydrolase [Lachnospiraceae bacterium]